MVEKKTTGDEHWPSIDNKCCRPSLKLGNIDFEKILPYN